MGDFEKKKRTRSEKFSQDEIDALLIFLESCPDLVSNEFGKEIQNLEEQMQAWDTCASFISANSLGMKRTAEQIKKKWLSIKSLTKKKASALKFRVNLTGSGPLKTKDKLTPTEEKIMELIGKTCAEGIISRMKGDLTYRQIHVSIFQLNLALIFIMFLIQLFLYFLCCCLYLLI